jgi:hypothetical protein
MRLTHLAMIASLLVPATALAQDQSYPPDVRAVLEEARKACANEGGQRVEFADDTVRRVDLTGDGRDDFIIDLTYAKCVDREYAFCGSAGCDHTIVVAKRGGGHMRVFSQQVNGYRIEGKRGARTIRFDVHGGFCGKSGAEDCVKRQCISEKPFAFKQR